MDRGGRGGCTVRGYGGTACSRGRIRGRSGYLLAFGARAREVGRFLMAIVSLLDVSLSFGGAPLLDRVNFQIERGERVCLVGRNGAGKSTLMKVIAGDRKSTRLNSSHLVTSYAVFCLKKKNI